MSAKYRSGETTMVDRVSQGETAGTVVNLGMDLLGIVHSDTDSGKLGAVSIPNFSAIYEVDKLIQQPCSL
jgi:hypothetical protein